MEMDLYINGLSGLLFMRETFRHKGVRASDQFLVSK